ncbi:MAG: hypothetical protein K0U41_04500 [Gammaproteobacteria bacterium]|nr:hypothetical protein [Gammaproteobacteria bacterium]
MNPIIRILYMFAPLIKGSYVTLAKYVGLDASGFSGNLDSTTTDVQALADAVDSLAGSSGPLEFENLDNRFSGTLSSGSIATERNITFVADSGNSQTHSSLNSNPELVDIDAQHLYFVEIELTVENDSATSNSRLIPDVTLYVNNNAESLENHYVRSTTAPADPDLAPSSMVFNVSFLKVLSATDVIRVGLRARTGSVSTTAQVTSSSLLIRAITVSGTAQVTGITSADQITVNNSDLTGVLNNSGNVQEALNRLDNTGLGAAPRTFENSFICSYGTLGNQDTWYGGRQTVYLIGETANNLNRNNVFELPDPTELGQVFDDLVTRGLGEVFTITIEYQGGSSTSIVRNSLTIRPASFSNLFDPNELPVTISRGASVTFRIDRVGANIGSWTRVSIGQSQDPVATFGEVVLQNLPWNNVDNAFLPPSSAVLKGYAFPVTSSNPNDGTLRQGLIDAGVSERTIYDGDYVVWTADSFTSWLNGDDWFVLSRNDLQRISRNTQQIQYKSLWRIKI